jgi:hypothetical protein
MPADAASPRSADTSVAPTTAMSTPGVDGRHRRTPTMIARHVPPMASATGLVAPSRTPATNDWTSAMRPPPSELNPKSLGSWLTMTKTAIPLR